MLQKNFNLLLKTEVITQNRKFPEKTENKKKDNFFFFFPFSINKNQRLFHNVIPSPISLFLSHTYTYRQSLSFHRQTDRHTKKQQADTP